MDFLKEWTLTVCVTLIISIIFSVLSPKGNMGRYFKVIIAMFIFISFLLPLRNADFDFEFPEFDSAQFEDSRESAYESIIENSVKRTLDEGGYISSSVYVKLDYNDNEIEIKKLEVGISDEFDKELVKKHIADKTGFNADVYYLGE